MSSNESVPSLTPNQILALVVLTAEAREVTNTDLKELAGFSLNGADNKKLEALGLVETDRSHRPFSHHVTKKGRDVVDELHTTTPPKAGGSAIRSLFTLLKNLHRALGEGSTAEFFSRERGPKPAPEPDVEQRIRAAYDMLPKQAGGWVGLADLRDRLPDLDRAAVDAALRAMAREPGVRIIPVANSASLQPRDRAAALRLGDQDNHVLSIGFS
jgi:hypothetical protein